MGVAGGGVADTASLVDEEAVQKTVRLSQRCSMEAIGRRFEFRVFICCCCFIDTVDYVDREEQQ